MNAAAASSMGRTPPATTLAMERPGNTLRATSSSRWSRALLTGFLATCTATVGCDSAADPGSGSAALIGYWDWDRRVMDGDVQMGDADQGRMRIAFSADSQCHYLWNEITRSDFQTPCTFSVDGDMIQFEGNTDDQGKLTGYSCTHQDWTSWAGDFVPPVQWSRFELRDGELWLAVNCHWSTVNGGTNSAKRFPFWESEEQALNQECWVVFTPSSQTEFCDELCPSYAPDPGVCIP